MTAWYRALVLLCPLLLLGGCVAAGALAVADGATVAVFGRDAVDIAVSAVTGRDCSVVRLDRRQTYCSAKEELPKAPPFCTRTLGTVQCWTDPEHFASLPRTIVDTPALTKEQAQQVQARWPKSLNLLRE